MCDLRLLYIELERLIDTYAAGLLATSSVITVQFHFTRHCISHSRIFFAWEGGVTLIADLGANCKPAAVAEGEESMLRTVMRIVDWAERRGPSVFQQCLKL